ncbi:GTPase HflX, partial [Akkermansiaceae bacterium]|nr:GTPase HflX [Akkermansiaceae bacterium]
EHYETTCKVLAELGADDKQVIIVLNKIDQVEDPAVLTGLRLDFPSAVETSALKGIGMDILLGKFSNKLSDRVKRLNYRIPQTRGDITGLLHNEGKVLSTDYEENDVLITAIVPKDFEERLAEFIVS